MPVRLSSRLGAEALGTALLVATVVGSGLMAERLASGLALALLVNSVATGSILFVAITVLAPVSGAHLNPAVSLVMGLRRELAWPVVALYVTAQIAGGIAGTIVAHLMFGQPALGAGGAIRMGGGQWLAEAVATFGLVLTILMALRSRPAALPSLVGCYIVAAYWFTASTSFANPAVTIARALTASFAGIRPLDAPAFIVSQLAGALLALGAERLLRERD